MIYKKRPITLKCFIAFKLLLFFFFLACNSNSKETINYCERIEADQSNLIKGNLSASEKESRFKKRKSEFIKNWKILEALIDQDRFSAEHKDSCFTEFIAATLIHNVQQYPEVIFSEKTVDGLAKELEKGNVMKNHLETVMIFYKDFTVDERRCIKMKERVDYAMNAWQVHENIEYIDCLE